METKAGTARTRIRRHPERAVPEQAEAILLAGRVAHVGFVLEGQPCIVPMTYDYDDGVLYVHGAPASRTVAALRAGMPVCVEVTLLDGLVASREAKSHSMNYRSVIVYGVADVVTNEAEKRAVFERMTARYFTGRTAGRDYTPARDADLRGVDLLAIRADERSAKLRTGPSLGPNDGDDDAPGTRFVVVLPSVDG
ncbi:MAG: pyridoxamine 5'-phosphate oxidase family protein [Ktedonobacterales bacterium]